MKYFICYYLFFRAIWNSHKLSFTVCMNVVVMAISYLPVIASPARVIIVTRNQEKNRIGI